MAAQLPEAPGVRPPFTPETVSEYILGREFDPAKKLDLLNQNRKRVLEGRFGVPILTWELTAEMLARDARLTGQRNRFKGFFSNLMVPFVASLKEGTSAARHFVQNTLWEQLIPHRVEIEQALDDQDQEEAAGGTERVKLMDKVEKFWREFVQGTLLSGRNGAYTASGEPIEPAKPGSQAIRVRGQEILPNNPAYEYMLRAEATARSAYALIQVLTEDKKMHSGSHEVFIKNPFHRGGTVFDTRYTDPASRSRDVLISDRAFVEALKGYYFDCYDAHQKELSASGEVALRKQQILDITHDEILATMSSDQYREKMEKSNGMDYAADLYKKEIAADFRGANDLLGSVVTNIGTYESMSDKIALSVYFEPDNAQHNIVHNEGFWNKNYVGALRVCQDRLELTAHHTMVYGGNELRKWLREVQVGSAVMARDGFTNKGYDRPAIDCPVQIGNATLEAIADKKYHWLYYGGLTHDGAQILNKEKPAREPEIIEAEFELNREDEFLSPTEIGDKTNSQPGTLAYNLIKAGRTLFEDIPCKKDEFSEGRTALTMEQDIRLRLAAMIRSETGLNPEAEVDINVLDAAYNAFLQDVFGPTQTIISLMQNELVLDDTNLMQMGIGDRYKNKELSPWLVAVGRGKRGVFPRDASGQIHIDWIRLAELQYQFYTELQNIRLAGTTHQAVLAQAVGIRNKLAIFIANVLQEQSKHTDDCVRGNACAFQSPMRDGPNEQRLNEEANAIIRTLPGYSAFDAGKWWFTTVNRSPLNIAYTIYPDGHRAVHVKLNTSYPAAEDYLWNLLLDRLEKGYSMVRLLAQRMHRQSLNLLMILMQRQRNGSGLEEQ